MQVFLTNYHVFHFDELFSKRLQKVLNSWKSTKNHPFGQIFATFRTNYHVFAFRWTFQEKVAKSASFREKARETIDLAKTFNFSSKLPCLRIFMNFSARSCKKCLIPWNSTRNHRFGQNYATFSNKLPCLCFSMNFSGKVAKSASFREKARKIIDLANLQLFEQFYQRIFDELCKKCLISWAQISIWPKCFRTNCHVFHLDELFRKNAKSASFREKARKRFGQNFQLFEQTTMSHFHELFKKLQKVRKHEKSSILSTCNFPRKLPYFDVSMNIAAKSCKKLLVPWESTKNHQFGQLFPTFLTKFDVFAFRWIFKEKVAKSTSFREKARKIVDLANTSQLFEQTTMFWHFDEVFSKKLQKVPHFVEKHEKSSIWWKLATFPTNYHVLTLWWTFQRKVAESASFSE